MSDVRVMKAIESMVKEPKVGRPVERGKSSLKQLKTLEAVAPDMSIQAALEPVKLVQCVCQRGCDVGSRFPVQALCLKRLGAIWANLAGIRIASAALSGASAAADQDFV